MNRREHIQYPHVFSLWPWWWLGFFSLADLEVSRKCKITFGIFDSQTYESQFWWSSHVCNLWMWNREYLGVRKLGYPKIIHFSRIFHYKPAMLGYPHDYGNLDLWNHQQCFPEIKCAQASRRCLVAGSESHLRCGLQPRWSELLHPVWHLCV